MKSNNIIYENNEAKLVDLCLKELRREEEKVIDETCYRSPEDIINYIIFASLIILILFLYNKTHLNYKLNLLTIISTGGLANRINSLASALLISILSTRNLYGISYII